MPTPPPPAAAAGLEWGREEVGCEGASGRTRECCDCAVGGGGRLRSIREIGQTHLSTRGPTNATHNRACGGWPLPGLTAAARARRPRPPAVGEARPPPTAATRLCRRNRQHPPPAVSARTHIRSAIHNTLLECTRHVSVTQRRPGRASGFVTTNDLSHDPSSPSNAVLSPILS